MGLFNFVEAAGRLLGFGHEAHPDAVQDGSKPAPAPPSGDAIADEIRKLGLAVSDLSVSVDGNTARVSGTAPDAATREKVILAAGNVAGIAKVDDQIALGGGSAPEARFHTVVKGDTLSAIAKEYYGNAGKYPAIFEANRPMLSDPDRIYPGQVLRIPAEA